MRMAGRGIGGAAAFATSVAFATALAACSASAPSSSAPPGGGSSSKASSTAPASTAPAGLATNSCDVITTAQASAALGQPVRPPVRGHAYVEGGVACVYYGPHDPPGLSPDVPAGDSVRVVLVTGSKAKKYFDDYRGKVHAQPISGLGDAAYYDGFASLSVLKGDAYVRIFVGTTTTLSAQLKAEESLARDALPRM